MRKDTKALLLEQGLQLFMQKGFNNTGLQEILACSGVPKGSFYHYFKSKEDFALQVIDRYAEEGEELFREILENRDLDPLERLKLFFERQLTMCRELPGIRGCLIGNMTQEMGHLCETFDHCLENHWNRICGLLAACIEEARARDQIAKGIDAQILANFILNSWQGALMRLKVAGNDQPLCQFMEVVFHQLLANQEAGVTAP